MLRKKLEKIIWNPTDNRVIDGIIILIVLVMPSDEKFPSPISDMAYTVPAKPNITSKIPNPRIYSTLNNFNNLFSLGCCGRSFSCIAYTFVKIANDTACKPMITPPAAYSIV